MRRGSVNRGGGPLVCRGRKAEEPRGKGPTGGGGFVKLLRLKGHGGESDRE